MSAAPIRSTVLHMLRQTRQQEEEMLAGLNEAERAATGTLEHPSTRDAVAHIAAWKERHAGKIATIVRGETPPRWNDMAVVNRLNAETYPLHQHQTWQQVADYAARAHGELLTQVGQLSEADLSDPQRWPALGGPIWPETLGNGVWHAFTHLLWLARERGDGAWVARVERAQIALQEALVQALDAARASTEDRANNRYDLACRCALAGQPTEALATLRDALAMRPELALHAKHDGDFASLHGDMAFQALIASVREAELIAPREVHAARDTASAPLVIDVREPDEYAGGHVRGARNIPLGQLAGHLDALPRDRVLVTYCMMGHRGSSRGERGALLLAEHGFAARALDGGLPGWQAAGLPVDTAPEG